MPEIPTLIFVNGPSASGKTYLGREVAKAFDLPFFSKDDFKELLFDNLGWSDREWSKKVGHSSFELLWQIARTTLLADKSLIIETKFDPIDAAKRIEEIKAEKNFNIIEINCFAQGEILLERFVERAKNNRHPGHQDLRNLEEFKPDLLVGRVGPLQIEGIQNIIVDTTDFAKIDLQSIIGRIREFLPDDFGF
ncbi:MAG: AAA family ATPase [Candidatus Berkelbacteria bacterium]|nr:AAA family ATPase [Candidatus Berkelbacteria bacterium]